MKKFLPCDVLKVIYNALVQPHLNYGILLWGNKTKRIIKLQKWSVRAITCSKYNAHTDPLFIQLNLLKVEDLYKLNLLKFYHKYKSESLPKYFSGMFENIFANHHYHTRHKEQSIVGRGKSSIADHSIRFALPNLIIKTHDLITRKISTHSLPGFSSYVKLFYISQYNSICTTDNCYVCNRNDTNV